MATMAGWSGEKTVGLLQRRRASARIRSSLVLLLPGLAWAPQHITHVLYIFRNTYLDTKKQEGEPKDDVAPNGTFSFYKLSEK